MSSGESEDHSGSCEDQPSEPGATRTLERTRLRLRTMTSVIVAALRSRLRAAAQRLRRSQPPPPPQPTPSSEPASFPCHHPFHHCPPPVQQVYPCLPQPPTYTSTPFAPCPYHLCPTQPPHPCGSPVAAAPTSKAAPTEEGGSQFKTPSAPATDSLAPYLPNAAEEQDWSINSATARHANASGSEGPSVRQSSHAFLRRLHDARKTAAISDTPSAAAGGGINICAAARQLFEEGQEGHEERKDEELASQEEDQRAPGMQRQSRRMKGEGPEFSGLH